MLGNFVRMKLLSIFAIFNLYYINIFFYIINIEIDKNKSSYSDIHSTKIEISVNLIKIDNVLVSAYLGWIFI